MKTLKLKPWYLLLCFTMLICSVACSKSDDSNSDDEEPSTINTEVLNAINAHRKNIDKASLIPNALANTLANEHSLYMASKSALSYDNFEERITALSTKENAEKILESAGYKYKSAKVLLDALLKDPGHKNNIENDVTHIGIGINNDSQGIPYYFLIFIKK